MPFGWVLLDLLTRKIKLRCIKSTVLGTLPFEMVTIRIRIKQLDPDPYQSDKQDPDPEQKGLDPRHCFCVYLVLWLAIYVFVLSAHPFCLLAIISLGRSNCAAFT